MRQQTSTTPPARTFAPPRRPISVRLFNAVGRLLRRLGLPPRRFDEQWLLAKGRRLTGLQDYGDETFRGPMRVLLQAYNDAELNPFGRLLAEWNIRALLCNRLRVQHALTSHPEIVQTPIRRPLFVLGLPRTGTTLLYNLLARDPAARPLLMWEAIAPAPRPGEEGLTPDPRVRRTAAVLRLAHRMAPSLAMIHPLTAEGPEECSRLLLNTFVTIYAVLEHHIPAYWQWIVATSAEMLDWSYRDYYRQLQVVQWQRPPVGHWVLKSPVHLFGLASLLKVFPDAAVVQLHRDPHKVVPSLCSLFATYQAMACDVDRSREIGKEVIEFCVEGLRRGEQARAAAPSERVLDIKYTDLMANPLATVRRIYDHFGYECSEAFERRAAGWHQGNPQHKHGKHRYDLEQFGLARAAIDSAFEDYCRQYEIEPEGLRSTAPACRSGCA